MTEPGLSEGLPSGTVSFLFTDIEGSTRLWDTQPSAMQAALARHDDILRKTIDDAEGYIFSTGGDGFAVVFSRAGNAVSAAVSAQRELAAEPWPEGVELRVRMGVNTGEVQERGGDYFGPPVNRAARLMGAANGGQIVVSGVTAALLDDSTGVELIDLGTVQLKGMVELVHAFGVDTPDADWAERPLVSTQTTAGNLPRPQTELVGDLADLQRRVSTLASARLVTLTGSGGVGKTRASIEIGWLVVDEFVDGVWMVELAPVADAEVVIAAVASTLAVQPQPGVPLPESVVDWFVGRRLLLIVDNCEHVLAPVIELVEAVGARCPTVTIVATSREPLGLPGEQVIRVPSLEPNFGVELFCDRARAANSSFAASADDLATIEAICARLDGIPLAIELAAARGRSLSPDEVLARLDDRFRLLRGSSRGGLERHQTLRATVTWSYQLLSSDDQLLFDRLSVFAGGFDLQAAERICAGDDVDEYDVIDLIGELVDKSMVIAERTGATTRYRLLETLRQYGEDRLDDRGEIAAVRDRHLAYYRELAGRVVPLWCTPDQLEADELCDREWDNFRAAHGWALARGDVGQAIEIIWGARMYAASRLRFEAQDWTTRTTQLADGEQMSDGRLLASGAFWAFFSGDFERSHELASACIDSELADDSVMALGQMMRLYGLMGSGRVDEAVAAVSEARELVARLVDPLDRFALLQALIDLLVGEADISADVAAHRAAAKELGGPTPLAEASRATGNLLLVSTDRRDLDEALAAFQESVVLADRSGAIQTGSWARLGVAMSLLYAGQDGFVAAVRETFRHARDARYGIAITSALEVCALHVASGQHLDATAILLGHLERQPPRFRELGKVRARSFEAVAGLANLDELRATGAGMSQSEAVDYTLDLLGSE